MKKGLLVFFLCFFFVFGCVTHEQNLQDSGAILLTQNQLIKLFSKTVVFDYTTPQRATQIFKTDGTTAIDIKGYKSDKGTYTISNGLYCSKWKNMRTTEKCYKIYKIGKNEYHLINSDGSEDSKGFLRE